MRKLLFALSLLGIGFLLGLLGADDDEARADLCRRCTSGRP